MACIKSPTIRRAVIIATIIPMLALVIFLGAMEGMCKAASQADRAIRNAWRGR